VAEVEDVVVHEEVAEVDHPCEVVGEEQGVVDEVDSVTVEVDEVVLEEDSFPEAHQGVDEVDSGTVVADEVVEVDTRLRIHVQYRLASCANSILIGADVPQPHDRQASMVRCDSSSSGEEYNIVWLRALIQYADCLIALRLMTDRPANSAAIPQQVHPVPANSNMPPNATLLHSQQDQDRPQLP
jgi:hypothetical protein